MKRSFFYYSFIIYQVPTEDISMRQEIMSRQEYRLYSAHMFGRAIAIKLYEGRRAKQV